MNGSPSNKKKRRWLRFGLRSLFALVTLSAVFLAFFGVRWYRDYLEQHAIQALKEAGARLDERVDGKVERVYLSGEKFNDAELARLASHLRNLPALREVWLVETPITDEGLQILRDVPRIEVLSLTATKISKEGLAEFRRAAAGGGAGESPRSQGHAAGPAADLRHAVIAAAFSPDGTLLATGSGDGSLRLWQADRSEPIRTLQAHVDWLFSVAFSPDGRMLATGGGDNLIRLWRASDLASLGTLSGHSDDVHSIAFASSDTLVSTGDDMTVRIWNVPARQERHVLEGHTRSIPSLALSPDRETVASGSRDGTIRLWNVASGELLHVFEGHTDDINSVSYSPDGEHLASASYDRTMKVWNVAAKTVKQTLEGHTDRVHVVAYAPDGEHLLSASRDGTLRRWDLATGEEDQQHRAQKLVAAIAFHPLDARIVTTAAEGSLLWWDSSLSSIEGRSFAVGGP